TLFGDKLLELHQRHGAGIRIVVARAEGVFEQRTEAVAVCIRIRRAGEGDAVGRAGIAADREAAPPIRWISGIGAGSWEDEAAAEIIRSGGPGSRVFVAEAEDVAAIRSHEGDLLAVVIQRAGVLAGDRQIRAVVRLEGREIAHHEKARAEREELIIGEVERDPRSE